MANTIIQIKRSANTAVPPSLANGELAFSANGGVLYIGVNNAVIPIAGQRTPGIVTANQAIITNANDFINVLSTNKLVIGVDGSTANITAVNAVSNSTQLGANSPTEIPTTSAVQAFVNSKVGAPPAAAGSNTQVQFNSSGVMGASANLIFDFANNNLTVANSVIAAIFVGIIDGGLF